jgi:hypothetical protein
MLVREMGEGGGACKVKVCICVSRINCAYLQVS